MITYQTDKFRVLDVHTHFAGNPALFDRTIARNFERLKPKQQFDQGLVGRDPAALLDYMNIAGIDAAAVMAEEGPPTNYSVENAYCLGYAAQSGGRIVPIGNVNPRIEPNVARRVSQLIGAGMRAFKLYCSDHNQNPHDRALLPMYELCDAHALPVFFHSGTGSRYPMSNPVFGQPRLFEDLFRRYPRISWVMCHGGKGGQHEDCVALVRQYPNTYIEISDMHSGLLRQICTDAMADRLVFGSDMPQFRGYGPLLARVLRLSLTVESRRKILFDNGARLLGLTLPQRANQPSQGEAQAPDLSDVADVLESEITESVTAP